MAVDGTSATIRSLAQAAHNTRRVKDSTSTWVYNSLQYPASLTSSSRRSHSAERKPLAQEVAEWLYKPKSASSLPRGFRAALRVSSSHAPRAKSGR